MKNNKIIFVTGEFLPNTESIGGVIRVFSFLKSLNNFKKFIVCRKGKFRGYFGLKKYLKDTKIVHVNKFSKYKDFIFIRILKFFFGNLFYLYAIDNAFFSLNLYKKEIDKILKKQSINKIIFSGPPFSLFYIIPHIKLHYPNIKIILDYRDGWGKRISKSLYFFKILQHKIEKQILSKTDYILCATRKIFNDIKSFKVKTQLIFLSNGFLNLKGQNSKKIKLNKDHINIGYFGLISYYKNSYRNINILNNSAETLKKKKINFFFFGNSKINKNLKKNNFFNFKKNVSYLKSQNLMKQFDYLFILHTEKSTVEEVITGKFYEYLLSGKPILVISNGKSEAGKIVKKYKIGIEIDYSVDDLSNSLNKLKKKFKMNKKISLKEFNRDFQNKKLINILKKL